MIVWKVRGNVVVLQTQVDQWHFLYKCFLDDAMAVARYKTLDWQYQIARPKALQLLSAFLNQEISVELFSAMVQCNARKTWGVLGLRGLSTSMFLYKLVNYITDTCELTQYLQTFLPLPRNQNMEFAEEAMRQFINSLEEFILTKLATRNEIQPARVPLFLSVWWHIQSPEIWPIFYPNARKAVLGDRKAIWDDPISLYFKFCRCFVSLAAELGISLFELEHVCMWYEQHKTDLSHPCNKIALDPYNPPTKVQQVKTIAEANPIKEENSGTKNSSEHIKSKKIASRHIQLQWFLAKIGLKVGYQVWIGLDNQDMVWNDERLGDLSLKTLPSNENMTIPRSISQIDVLWLHKKEIVVAYEIEHDRKADITTSLLRLSDLAACFPRRNLQMCVVAPQKHLERIKLELPRPAFQGIKKLALLCDDALIKQHEHILRWANNPSIVQDLISHVGDESLSMVNTLT